MTMLHRIPNADGNQALAVSMPLAVTVLFGLISTIGFILTWNTASANERQSLRTEMREIISSTISAHDEAITQRFNGVEQRLQGIEQRFGLLERQVNINTGELSRMRGGR